MAVKRLRMIACVLAGLFILGAAAQAGQQVKTLSGTVTFICPQHKAIKVKCAGGKTWALWVDEQADNAAAIKQQIKQLKVHDSVTVHYYVRDGKKYIKGLKKTA